MPDIADSSGDAALEVGQQMSTAERQEFEAILTQLSENDPSLTDLDLTCTAIGDPEAASLADALRWNTALTRLDLTDNDIQCAGAVELGKALRQNTALTELCLCGNPIGDNGIVDGIAWALQENSTLTALNLSHTLVRTRGVNAIEDALVWNTTLARLDFDSDLRRRLSVDPCLRLCLLLGPEQRAHRREEQKQSHRRFQLVLIGIALAWVGDIRSIFAFGVAVPGFVLCTASVHGVLAKCARFRRREHSLIATVRDWTSSALVSSPFALAMIPVIASLLASMVLHRMSHAYQGAISLFEHKALASASLMGSFACFCKLVAGIQHERNATAEEKAAMQHLLEQHDRLAVGVRRMGLFLFPVAVICHLTNGDLVNAAFPFVSLSIIALLPATHQCHILILRVTHYIALPSRAILGALGMLPSQSFIPASIGFPLCAALLNTSVPEHLTDVLWVNAVVLFFAKTTLQCTLSIVMSVLSCGLLVLKLARMQEEDAHEERDESLRFQEASTVSPLNIAVIAKCAWFRRREHPLLALRDWKSSALVSSPFALAMIFLTLHQANPSVISHLAHKHSDALRNALASASLMGSFACFCKLIAGIQHERNATAEEKAAMQCRLEQHDRLAVGVRRMGLYLYPVAALYHLKKGDLATAAFPVVWFSIIALLPATHQCHILILRVTHYILIPSRAILGALGMLPVQNIIPASIGFPLSAALLHTSVPEHLADVLLVNAVVLFCAKTTLECTLSIVMATLSCGLLVLKLARMQEEDERDEEASQAPEASREHSLIATVRDWTSSALVSSPFALAMIPVIASLLASMVLHRMSHAYQGAISLSEHKALASASLMGSFACFCKLVAGIQHERNATAEEKAAMQHLLEQHDRLAIGVRRMGLFLFPVGVICHLINGDLATVAFPVVQLCLFAVLPAKHQSHIFMLRISHYIFIPSRAILGALGMLSSQSFLPASIGFPLSAALLHTSVPEHLADVLLVNAVVLFCAKTTLQCTVSIVMAALSCGLLVLKLARMQEEDERHEEASQAPEASREQPRIGSGLI